MTETVDRMVDYNPQVLNLKAKPYWGNRPTIRQGWSNNDNPQATGEWVEGVVEMLNNAMKDADVCEARDLWEARIAYVQTYAWALCDEQAIALAAQYGPILEVGSGTGWWAALLQMAGVDIIATDVLSDDESSNHRKAITWTDIAQMSSREAVNRYRGRTLMLVWPDDSYNQMATAALRAYEGDTVIYVGEGSGGCCAGDGFFKELNDDRLWKMVASHSLAQWDGIHDHMTVWARVS